MVWFSAVFLAIVVMSKEVLNCLICSITGLSCSFYKIFNPYCIHFIQTIKINKINFVTPHILPKVFQNVNWPSLFFKKWENTVKCCMDDFLKLYIHFKNKFSQTPFLIFSIFKSFRAENITINGQKMGHGRRKIEKMFSVTSAVLLC